MGTLKYEAIGKELMEEHGVDLPPIEIENSMMPSREVKKKNPQRPVSPLKVDRILALLDDLYPDASACNSRMLVNSCGHLLARDPMCPIVIPPVICSDDPQSQHRID